MPGIDHEKLGHLYVIDGDLQQLAVDAWLLPTDSSFKVTASWATTQARFTRFDEVRKEGWSNRPVVFLEEIDGSDVWLGDVGRARADESHYVNVALAFIKQAAEKCRGRAETVGRLPLVALNHLGTGDGGAYERHGEILSALVREIRNALNEGVLVADVVLVAWGEQPESASQYFRETQSSSWENDPQWDFGDRTEDLHSVARDLAMRARDGQLSVFLGAGTSIGAGLPSWKALLDGIAAAAGILGDGETLEDLQDLRDQAALIDARLRRRDTPSSIHQHLKTALSHSKYSLQHGLISSLSCNEFITTNVDELFENACRAGGRPLTVMPKKEGDGKRWLLKLHGTVSDPEGMVFTRENYLDAGRSSRALLGLVQAMLFTRHMLFVGYGLADEDFHELVYEVKRAFGTRRSKEPIGTVLLLSDEPLKSEIWAGTLNVVSVGASAGFAQNARDVARFLDLVGMLSAEKHLFFLDRRYSHPSTDPERELAQTLRHLSSVVNDKNSPVWTHVEALLKSLGWDPKQGVN
jgi:hypothetical protein